MVTRWSGGRAPHRVPVRSRVFALPCEAASVPTARRFVQATLHEWHLPTLSDDASLATTELAANAISHARTDLVITVLLADRLLISVGDGRPGLLHVAPTADDADAEGGRGLFITDALAQAWGTFPDRGGKAVWFTLPLPAADQADAELAQRGRTANATFSEMLAARTTRLPAAAAGRRRSTAARSD